ncbi:glycosyltransferase family 4 protein [Candidatus Methylocalor cossyra]|uniref:Glycosyltransferase n=1 Tax=Candidatus Methylocalor cossyra TaxID=3108543 RepID=A0ABM9NGY3_9GAMM
MPHPCPRVIPNRLKIGFLTAQDPTDRGSWSGIIHYLATALARHAGEVVRLGPAFTGRELRLQCWSEKLRARFGRIYDFKHSIYLSAGYAGVFHYRLQKNPVDVIFAPVAATEIALLKTTIPIVYMSDTTFAALANYYEEFSNLFAISRLEANLIERWAMRKAARLIYPSSWAANSAVRDYGVDRDKIHVFPMGANIDAPPKAEHVIKKQRGERLQLLFVGVDWQRKGGTVAFETLLALQQLGVPTTLTVVGCTPPPEFSHPAVKVIPYLNKNIPEDRKRLNDLYLNADIFLLPTRAECFGIVFCEAAAFGLPSFASDTGGVAAVIEHERTGFLFPLDATGKDYAKVIADLWRNPARLAAMTRASRERFDNELTWEVWGKRAAQVLHAVAEMDAKLAR